MFDMQNRDSGYGLETKGFKKEFIADTPIVFQTTAGSKDELIMFNLAKAENAIRPNSMSVSLAELPPVGETEEEIFEETTIRQLESGLDTVIHPDTIEEERFVEGLEKDNLIPPNVHIDRYVPPSASSGNVFGISPQNMMLAGAGIALILLIN